jgi:hypothetical protein
VFLLTETSEALQVVQVLDFTSEAKLKPITFLNHFKLSTKQLGGAEESKVKMTNYLVKLGLV